ncbi:hypothetical protein D5086_011378 [Populus alba]|uniref:Uncharacterized protein n=2 Tax=Populus alba TaxID=43335 RepID=A0ACC4CCC6_POPAL|nr:hypothetical protein D5086_0000154880 [Populus alba]
MDGAKEKGGDSGYSELSEVEVGICGADPIRITEWTHEANDARTGDVWTDLTSLQYARTGLASSVDSDSPLLYSPRWIDHAFSWIGQASLRNLCPSLADPPRVLLDRV